MNVQEFFVEACKEKGWSVQLHKDTITLSKEDATLSWELGWRRFKEFPIKASGPHPLVKEGVQLWFDYVRVLCKEEKVPGYWFPVMFTLKAGLFMYHFYSADFDGIQTLGEVPFLPRVFGRQNFLSAGVEGERVFESYRMIPSILSEVVERQREEDQLFYIGVENQLFFPVLHKDRGNRLLVELCYQQGGVYHDLVLQISEDASLTVNQDDTPIQTREQGVSHIMELIEGNERKQTLRSLIAPPRRYFDREMEINLATPFIREVFHNHLIKRYPVDQIEVHMRLRLMGEYQRKFLGEDRCITCFLDTFVVTEQREDGSYTALYMGEEEEQALSYMGDSLLSEIIRDAKHENDKRLQSLLNHM